MDISVVSYLSNDILEFIIKKLDKEINDKDLPVILRIHSYLTLKKLYKSNKSYEFLFKNIINKPLILSGYMLDNIELLNEDLRGIQFSHASMKNVIFINCNLTDVNLEYCDLENANLNGSNLESVNLTGANITGANINNVNFKNADVKNIILNDVNLKEDKIKSNL